MMTVHKCQVVVVAGSWRTNARREVLTRTETDLQARFLELVKLREQVRTAEVSADLQKEARARKPAPVVISAAV
jgi:hypothetical protein